MAYAIAQPSALTPEEIAQTQLARQYVDCYARIVHGVQPQFHHLPWYDHLQGLADQGFDANVPLEERCCVVVAPPGTAKSTVISQLFPPWYLGRHPDHHVIFLTAADTSATRFNTTIKGILEADEKHGLSFPDEACRPDFGRGWSGDGLYLQGSPKLEKEPAFLATGWGANIVGNRAHGIILDDPLTQEQAESPVVQEAAKAYLKGTVIPRLIPGGWVVLVTTRWHENDLGGYCSKSKDKGGLGWKVIHLKALDRFAWSPRDDHGDLTESSCWETRFPTAMFATMRALDPANFETVYQGSPTSRGADIFRREWFKPLPLDWKVKGEDGKTHEERCSIVQFWDLAFGDKTFNDFTACVTLAYDGTRFFVIHVLHIKVRLLVEAADDNMKGLGGAMARHILRMRPNVIGVEAGAFNLSATVRRLVFRVQQLLKDEEMAAVINLVRAEKDKVRRSELAAQEAKAGFVHADQNADWWPDYVAELVAFPNAEHDDQVDATSGAVQAAIEAGVAGEGRGKTPWNVRQPTPAPDARNWDWLKEIQDQWSDEIAALALTTGGRFR